jgi:hypothetical protein
LAGYARSIDQDSHDIEIEDIETEGDLIPEEAVDKTEEVSTHSTEPDQRQRTVGGSIDKGKNKDYLAQVMEQQGKKGREL